MAAAVFKPLFFAEALLPHYHWKASNEVNPSRKMEQEIPLVVKISNEAASNDWKVFKLCAETGINTIRKMGAFYSNYIMLSKRPDFSLNSRYTGTPLNITSTVISGYWMGPDDEDECGFVQALVQRIS